MTTHVIMNVDRPNGSGGIYKAGVEYDLADDLATLWRGMGICRLTTVRSEQTGAVVSATTGNFPDAPAMNKRIPVEAIPSGSGVGKLQIGGATIPAGKELPTGKLTATLDEALVDASMLVVGDSTGNDTYEWVDLFCAWAAATWPAYTVRRWMWDNTSKTYATSQDFNVGTSARVFNVWNCSVPGSMLSENFGSPYATAFVGKAPSLIVISHGYNYANGTAYYGVFGALSAGVESLLREYPFAGVLMVAQSPFRDTDNQAINIRAVKEYAGLRGFGVADVYSAYLRANKDTALYLPDGIHPSNPDGGQLWLSEILPHFVSRGGHRGFASTLDQDGVNLLPNGGFDAVTGAVPDTWTLTNCTTAVETTIFETGVRSIKLTANGATPRIQQDLLTTNLAAVKKALGGYVTLAARVYVPAGGAITCGTIALRTDEGEIQSAKIGANGVTAGWHWRVVSGYVPKSPTLFRAYVYADTATGTTQYCYVDRVVLVRGLLPKDV